MVQTPAASIDDGVPHPPRPDPLWETAALLAARFRAHDDGLGLGDEEQWTLQVLKIAEESGEAAQAVIGARGTNPRKERADWGRVHEEVADVVITAAVALARMRPDAGAYLLAQLDAKARRFLAPADGA
ncbi:MazG-like family protein [Streptomyces polyrhachis]|uniref:MazG-like family protein n=1 Tax=Streptomyces polyrhachis TaxID=1282885 RepID=A0ABW2GDR5_9ACTN